MPNRVIKESLWTSPNFNALSDMAERHFYRLLLVPDDFGCCEITPAVVKGKCYPLKNVKLSDIEVWQDDLEKNQILVRWHLNGREYAVFPTFARHQRVRALHQRKTPIPPQEVEDRCTQILTDDSNGNHLTASDDKRQQVSSNDRLNPNPNPNPNPNLYTTYIGVFDHWNVKGIVKHEKMTAQMQAAIRSALKNYSEEQVKTAIDNYSQILFSQEHFFKYRWTLQDFLRRGLEKFLDLNVALMNYRKDKDGNSQGSTGKPEKHDLTAGLGGPGAIVHRP